MGELRLVDIGEDDFEDVLRVRVRSFGPIGAGGRETWIRDAKEFVADRRFVGVAAGDEVVAAARYWDFRQWWGGRQVRMAGVAGVVVAPEYRGRGVGSLLMRGVLRRAGEQGYPVSALYPATTVLYRRLGYEFGGGRYRFSYPTADLRSFGGKDVPVRRAGAEDAARFLELASALHARGRSNGVLIWPEAKVAEWLADEELFAYAADDGFVAYRWHEGNLLVEELLAGSEATARALWATVGSGSSTARLAHVYGAPYDAVQLLAEHEAEREAHVQRWMLRLLDAPAAVAARGFAPGIAVEAELELDDREVPANAGRWHLSVAEGTGRLTRSTATGDALRLGPRGLAALYSGTPVAALRLAGLASGGPAAGDGVLDAAFGGAASYMLDFF